MMLSRRPLLMGAAAVAFTAANAYAQTAADFLGEWFGALDMGSQRLRLRLVIETGPRATLYSIDQGNSAIPVGETQIEGDRLTLAIPVINARYEGRFSGGRIEGEFTQRATLPLAFSRERVSDAAPPAEALTQARLAALRAEAGAPAFAAAAANRDGRRLDLVDGVRALGRPEPATTSDLWHIGSMTKSMTATLVARAAEAGLVSWDDTIGAVLGQAIPDMRAEYSDVTFRHLCCHRSGLPGNIEMAQLLAFPRHSDDSRADRIAYARLGLQQAPLGPKGDTFTYSNTGYVIVGAMLETKLGAAWETLIRRYVFGPLGMTSAGFGAPGAPGAYDQPVGHALGATTVSGGQAAAALEPHPPGSDVTDNPAVLGPAGTVHVSLDDLLKYLAAHRDHASPFLTNASWQTLHTPPFGGPYAMGWAVRGDMLWHNGSNTLWYSEMMFDRTRGISAAAATNDGRAGEMGRPIGAVLVGAAQAVA